MGSLPVWKGATMMTIQIQNNLSSSIALSCASSTLQLHLLQNVIIYPPPTHTFLKRPFLTDFKKYTHTPPAGRNFGTLDKKFINPRKSAKTHRVGAL